MADGSSRRFAELARVIMRSESLDELPEVPLDSGRASLYSKLMNSESLPLDEEAPLGRHAPLATGLFAPEVLPSDVPPESRGGRPSFLAMLFSREALPVDPAPEARPAGRGHGR